MNKVILFGFVGLMALSCENGASNRNASDITIRVTSLPGVTPFPDGTTYEAYVRSGPYYARTYDFLNTVECLPTANDPFILEGTLMYHGDYPVTIELASTEAPIKWNQPNGFSDPFNSQSIYFDLLKKGSKVKELFYAPNYWIELSVYAEHSTSSYVSGLFSIGSTHFNTLVLSLSLDEREFIGDTIQKTGVHSLSYGTNASLYLDEVGSGGDSLLHYVGYNDLLAQDTTYVFYDADKDSIAISY